MPVSLVLRSGIFLGYHAEACRGHRCADALFARLDAHRRAECLPDFARLPRLEQEFVHVVAEKGVVLETVEACALSEQVALGDRPLRDRCDEILVYDVAAVPAAGLGVDDRPAQGRDDGVLERHFDALAGLAVGPAVVVAAQAALLDEAAGQVGAAVGALPFDEAELVEDEILAHQAECPCPRAAQSACLRWSFMTPARRPKGHSRCGFQTSAARPLDRDCRHCSRD